jgi:hypothetical protein
MLRARLVVLGSFALALAACAEGAVAASSTSVASSPANAAPAMPPPSGELAKAAATDAGAARVHLEVKSDSGGLDLSSNAAYQAARPNLEHCHPGTAGKLEVRLTKQDRSTQLRIQPGASLDPTEGHCVLEALSTVDLDETAGKVGGPAVKPSGFTSHITISW